MANINQLSNELLLAIVAPLPSASLYSLTLTSRLLYSVAIQPLYKNIFFEGDGRYERSHCHGVTFERDKQIHSFLDFESPPNASQATSLEMLARSIEASRALRSLVFHIDVAWPTKGCESGHLRKLLNSLGSSQAVDVHLYLSTFFTFPPPESPVTLLAIHNKTRPEEEHAFQRSTAHDYSRLMYRHFAIPALKDLRLDMWDLWGYYIGPSTPLTVTDTESRRGTSNVSRLEIHDCGPCEGVLEIITWPKALRSFSCTFHTSGIYAVATQPLSRGLQYALGHHQRNLEELSISSDHRIADWSLTPDAQGLSLHGYSKLTRLCIDLDLLYPTAHDWDHVNQYNGSATTIAQDRSLYMVLPPNLVELQLILVCVWYMTDNMDDISHDGREICASWVYELKYLEDLALSANTHVQKLETVGAGDVWHGKSSWNPEEKVVSAEGEKIKAMFEAAGINFYFWKGRKPDFGPTRQ